VLPCFKSLQLIIYTSYSANCPWQNQIEAKYLIMLFITTSTIYRTVFVTLLLLICKGWVIIRSSLSQRDVSTLTVLMGATYLCNSAYFVSINAP
jgi:hypothetical protein